VRSRLGPRARSTARKIADAVLAPAFGSWDSATATDNIALTLDDGPDPDVTPAILERLADLDATATFFLLTLRAEGRPDLVRMIRDGGHEIALHGLDHRRVSSMSGAEAEQYLATARRRLEDVAGAKVTMFRPPYGSQSAHSVRAARRAGLQCVVWNGDAADWEDRPAAQVTAAALQACRPGGILLFHERLEPDPRHPDPIQSSPVTTFDRVQVMSDIVAGARALGLEPVTVGGLSERGRMHQTAWLRP
jgi:peptidoglycan/xylan/chitin deacetylase (PgdA/CDA1 family)